ncbi:unnamed protein product [Gulo gulo]|uniref:Uncharacterized protein n=1 Tax=Gulo gulo TaxID=48420 RepID=A0A9X9LIW1_GULGU|nr:unnamed protein product [Gulo gulo]
MNTTVSYKGKRKNAVCLKRYGTKLPGSKSSAIYKVIEDHRQKVYFLRV